MITSVSPAPFRSLYPDHSRPLLEQPIGFNFQTKIWASPIPQRCHGRFWQHESPPLQKCSLSWLWSNISLSEVSISKSSLMFALIKWDSSAGIKNLRYICTMLIININHLSSSALSWRLSVALKAAAALENSWWCLCWCCSWSRCWWPWCRCCFLCCLRWPGCWWPWWPRALFHDCPFPWKKRLWKLRVCY